MNSEKLMEAIGAVDSGYLEEALSYRPGRRWVLPAVAAACLILILPGGLLLGRHLSSGEPGAAVSEIPAGSPSPSAQEVFPASPEPSVSLEPGGILVPLTPSPEPTLLPVPPAPPETSPREEPAPEIPVEPVPFFPGAPEPASPFPPVIIPPETEAPAPTAAPPGDPAENSPEDPFLPPEDSGQWVLEDGAPWTGTLPGILNGISPEGPSEEPRYLRSGSWVWKSDTEGLWLLDLTGTPVSRFEEPYLPLPGWPYGLLRADTGEILEARDRDLTSAGRSLPLDPGNRVTEAFRRNQAIFWATSAGGLYVLDLTTGTVTALGEPDPIPEPELPTETNPEHPEEEFP